MKEFKSSDLKNNYYGEKEHLKYILYNKKEEFNCIYCKEKADSREHLPSKVFLNIPYPENLAIVPACKDCNNSFSKDEEYLACLIEILKVPNFEFEFIERSSIRKKLLDNDYLKKMFLNSIEVENNSKVLIYDIKRVENVLIKLARGHLVYMNSYLTIESIPKIINFKFLNELTNDEYLNFNSPIVNDISGEIGSRLSIELSIMESGLPIIDWLSVQENQYRFLCNGNNLVRICISEFLFAELFW